MHTSVAICTVDVYLFADHITVIDSEILKEQGEPSHLKLDLNPGPSG